MWFSMKIKSVNCYLEFVPWYFIPNFPNYSEAEVNKSKSSKIHAYTWTEKWKIVSFKVLFTIMFIFTIYIFW